MEIAVTVDTSTTEYESSPYDLGWEAGYYDELTTCPFPADTPEYKEWYEGYEQGSMDC